MIFNGSVFSRQLELDTDLLSPSSWLLLAGFLHERGFMVSPDREKASVVFSLREFQSYYGLEQTGRLDSETVSEIVKPRCGCRNVAVYSAFHSLGKKPEIPGTIGCVWENKKELVVLLGNLTGDEKLDKVVGGIESAFREWERAGVFEFRFVWSGVADIELFWSSDGKIAQMLGNVVARSDFPPGCSELVNKPPYPIIMLDSKKINWRNGTVQDAFDIRGVLVHEIGHMLGLDHSKVAGSVMRDTFVGGGSDFSVSCDDKKLLRKLYSLAEVHC